MSARILVEPLGRSGRGQTRIERVAQPLDDGVDGRRVDDEGRRQQDMVAGGAVGMSMSGMIEDGMATMSAKFKEMGGQVYLDAEKVKESNRVL